MSAFPNTLQIRRERSQSPEDESLNHANSRLNLRAARGRIQSMLWLLACLGFASLPVSAQMVEGRKIPGFNDTFGVSKNEAAIAFKAILIGSSAPANVLWPGEDPTVRIHFVNKTDQPISATGKIEVVAYATKGRPGDIWVPDMFKISEAGSVPVQVDLKPKGYTNLTVALKVPATFGAYGIVADLGPAGREFVTSMVRTFKPDPKPVQYPQFCTDNGDINLLTRLGLAPNRIGAGYKPTTDKDFEEWYKKFGASLMAYKQAGLPITLEIGGGAYRCPEQPLGRERPWLDDKGVMMDTKFDLAWLPSYDEDFRKFCKRIVSDYGWPKGPLNGIKLWNEPWNGISISGWGADDLRYREIFMVLCQATREACQESGNDVLIGGCDSSSNTFDKLFGDGQDTFLPYLDFCSIHYQGMACPSTYKPWVNRKGPHGRVRVWDTESWVANTDDRVAAVIAANLSTGHDRAIGVYHGNIATGANSWETFEYTDDAGKVQRTNLVQSWSVAASMGAASHFIGERKFRELLFKNGLPWIMVFDGIPGPGGKPNSEDGTVVVVGDIGEEFGADNVLFRTARGLKERAHEAELTAQLAVLPKDAPAADRKKLRDQIALEDPLSGATLTLKRTSAYGLYDFYGNPVEAVSGKIVVPLDHRGCYLRGNGKKGSFDKLLAALRTARIDGIEPLAKACLDPTVPIASKPALRLRLSNVLNRRVKGVLKVTLGHLTLAQPSQALSFQANETREIAIQVTGGEPVENNTYPLALEFDAGADGRSTHQEDLHVNSIARRTINVDGNLDDWKGVLPQTMSIDEVQKATLQEFAWQPFKSFDQSVKKGAATGFLAYDDQYFYFAAKIADTTPDAGMLRYETRNEDEFFYPEKCFAKQKGTNQLLELTWPEGVRHYSYRKDPELPAGNFPNHDNVQLAFNVIPPEKKDWYPCPPGTMPGYTGYKDTDYEYALNPVAEKYGGGTEIWRLQYPGMPHKHHYPHSPKSPLDGPVKDGKLVIRRDANTRFVEAAIPWKEIPTVRQALDEGRPIKFSFRVNDNAGVGCLELSRNRSVAKRNGSFTVDWGEHWANELEFGWQK